MLEAIESLVVNVVHWLRLAVEVTGALVIALGIAVAVYHFARTFAATAAKLRRSAPEAVLH